MIKELRVRPGVGSELGERDASSTPRAPGDQDATAAATAELLKRIQELQEKLYAEHRRSLLVVLEGVDGAGKDGTIRHVIRGLNPAGTPVTAFKVPTDIELDHDFLWRVHPHAPGAGEIAVFNRSYYEDVTAVRVRRLVADSVWRERFEHINAFERLLAHRGTTILKCYLHISKPEQAARMRARAADPAKRWKLTEDDIAGHQQYDEYRSAFEEAIDRTSTDLTPWWVIPADHKWYRNWAVAVTLHSTLVTMDPAPPKLGVPLGLETLT